MTLGEGSAFALPTDNDDILAQALALAGAGIPVFPAHGLREDGGCTCGKDCGKSKGKHPATAHGHTEASTDLGKVEQWFKNTRFNLGLPTGQVSGLVVIDVDQDSGGMQTIETWDSWGPELPPTTLKCHTGSGGLHLFYAVPSGLKITNAVGVVPGIDIRGDGGYVVAAPSRHRSGDRYRWLNPGADVARLVDWPDLRDWLMAAKGTAGFGGGGGAVPGFSFADADGAGEVEAGTRDAYLFQVLVRAKERGLDLEGMLAAARGPWEKIEQAEGNPYPWSNVVKKAAKIWDNERYQPVKLDPKLTEIAHGLVASLASGVQAAPVAGQEEVAESTAGVGSSQPPRVGGPLVEGSPPDFVADLTDTGNAHRFVQMFGDKVMHVAGLGWHIWDTRRWRQDDTERAVYLTLGVLQVLRTEQQNQGGDEAAATRVRRWYEASSSDRARRAMLRLAATDPRVATTLDDLNQDPWSLVVENGTVDLRTGNLRASDPADRNTRCAAVTYDPAARCPEWQKHIARITQHKNGKPDPVLAAYIQRWAGYSLTGMVSAEKFFFGFGKGRNGKNVLIETLLDLLGDYGYRAGAKIFSDKEHDTVIASLAGRRMVFVDETVKQKINDGRVKMLTGSSHITARKIAKDPITFLATFKLWLAGNNKPRVDDTSEAFWQRLELVPFDTIIPVAERIPDYGKVLQAEWSGILNWALEGLKDYLSLGSLGRPDRVETAVGTYRSQEDTFGLMLDDCFVVGDNEEAEWIPNEVLKEVIHWWFIAQGDLRPPSLNQASRELEQHGFSSPTRATYEIAGRKVYGQRGRIGPRLRDDLRARWSWVSHSMGSK